MVFKRKYKVNTHRSKFYSVWSGMIKRCTDENNKSYIYYGGRGIAVCDEWMDFDKFYDDMFPSYSPELRLDRVNNEGGYEKSNCRWVNHIENCRNRRSCHKIINPETNEEKTITEWALIYQIPRNTINSRIRLGVRDFNLLIRKSDGLGRPPKSKKGLQQ